MHWRHLFLALALAAMASPAMAQMKTTNQAIRAAKAVWKTGDYPAAYAQLIGVRKLPYGRTVEVDFMLATSACQTGKRTEGVKLLTGLLGRSLKAAERSAVREQIGHCGGTGGPVIVMVNVPVVSTSGGYGKTYYWLDRTSPLASYPATRTAEIAAAELDARLFARGSADTLKTRLAASGCRVAIGEFVVLCSMTSAIPASRLTAIAAEADAFIRFLDRSYGIRPADEYVTIRLVRSVREVQRLADQLHGLDVSPSTIAYSFRDDLSVAAVSQGGSGSILHELAHLAMRRDFGDAPQWFEEGLASLYEVAVRCGDRFDGVDNWRGDLLRRGWRGAPPLDRIVSDDWRGVINDTYEGETPAPAMEVSEHGRALAEAKMRYTVLLLQERGKLADLYRQLKAIDAGAREADTAAGVLRALVETTAPTLDAELERFVRAPATRDGRQGACEAEATVIRKDIPRAPGSERD